MCLDDDLKAVYLWLYFEVQLFWMVRPCIHWSEV